MSGTWEQDYIMRLIGDMIKFIAKIFLGKSQISYEDEYSHTDLLHKRLLELIELGKINEAENLLCSAKENKHRKGGKN